MLAINPGMFVAEFIGGYLAESPGLIADSLDMFADAAVDGDLASRRLATRRPDNAEPRRLSGYVQLLLALGGLGEVARRTVMGSKPQAQTMALLEVSRSLQTSHLQGGADMKASWIFTSNDVVVNIGVIVAAAW